MLLEGYVSNLDDENDKIYRLNELIKQNAQRNLAKRAEWEQRHPIISEIQKSYQPRIGAIPSYNGQVAEWENQAKYGLQAPIKEQFKTTARILGRDLIPSANITATIATGGENALNQLGTKALKPLLGNKIARMTAEGIGSGLVGGGVEEIGRAMLEGEKPLDVARRGLIGAGAGAGLGGLLGFGAGKIGRNMAKKNLVGNPEAQMNFYDDYIEGLNNNAVTKQGFGMNDIRGLKAGNYGNLEGAKLLDQDSFHGTPFQGDIQKFDLDFMGTGEGAQMYGTGIYTAKSRDVANRHYRFLNNDAEPISYKGKPIMELYNQLERKTYGLPTKQSQPYYDRMALIEDLEYKGGLDDLDYYSPEVQNWYKNEIEPNLTMPGRLYKVQVPDNDVLLHSDLPLNEQPEKVQKALRDMFFDQGIDIDNPKNIYDMGTLNQKPYSEVSGQTLYDIMNGIIDGNATNRRATSQLFDEYGIKGIRAFGDRDGEIFVTFNPDNAKIVESYYPNKVYNQPKLLNKPKLSGKINYIDDMTDAEMAKITSEFNTNLTNAERKKKFVARAVGNYYYKARNNGFNDYKFIGRYLIDDLFD